MRLRANLVLVLGVVMIALGAYVAVHPIWAPHHPYTGVLWLDFTFAFVFLVRGAMNVRAALRVRRK